jgi:hypothetical protein
VTSTSKRATHPAGCSAAVPVVLHEASLAYHLCMSVQRVADAAKNVMSGTKVAAAFR